MRGSAPAVSIILPCRDAAATLAAAIASIDAQTFDDYEVVALDDASTDATGDLLRAWAASNPRVRVVEGRGDGLVAALQQGTMLARGSLLARMDADDVMHATRLERQFELLAAEPDVVACGTRVRYFPRERLQGGARRYEQWLNALCEPVDLARDIFVECPIAHPALMMRRSAFDGVGGYQDRGWPEDYDLVLRLWGAGGALANVPEVLLDWRDGEQRMSRTDGRYTLERFTACRAHYVVRYAVRGRGVVVWGAGPVGKQLARALCAEGAELRAFVDLDPRKIGQTIHGADVIAPHALDAHRDAFIVAAVAGAGPRAEIRAALDAAGLREGAEYCVAA